MTSRHSLATLTLDGWVNQSIVVVDQMLSDFFLSEYSQTFAFTDKVASFPWILARYQNDLDKLCQETQSRLSIYLSRQFDDVEVSITHQLEEASINRHALLVYLAFRDGAGEVFTLARIARYDGLKVNEINKILTGEA